MKKPVQLVAALSFLAIVLVSAAFAAPRHPNVASLSKNSRELFITAMQWGDHSYDAEAKLCRMPLSGQYTAEDPSPYLAERESAWYAAGLLLRDGPGDRDRAAQILDTVLKAQYRDPGKPWDGTFRRTPSEPAPGPNAKMWSAYDPNWREFIGTTFAVILSEYPDRVPKRLQGRMINALDYAVAGEMKQGRLLPTYTNISLMYGFLWNFAAVRGRRPEWIAQAEHWQKTTYELYKQHDAFSEFNSPTYSGTDIVGLALWRDYGFTQLMRQHGEDMEAGLWRSTADFYNANLRNISGPYDRAYGMDMQSYVSVTGLWLRTVLDASQAPLTALDKPQVDHVGDLWIVPLIVVLDTRIPSDAMTEFKSFVRAHPINHPIEGKRVATAWIGKTLIYGGEITGQTLGVEADSQFHPVTAQWLTPEKTIGWLNLTGSPYLDADATEDGLAISTMPGTLTFRLSAPGVDVGQATAGEWKLDGLTVHIDTDGHNFKSVQGEGYIDVTYTDVSRMNMRFKQDGQ